MPDAGCRVGAGCEPGMTRTAVVGMLYESLLFFTPYPRNVAVFLRIINMRELCVLEYATHLLKHDVSQRGTQSPNSCSRLVHKMQFGCQKSQFSTHLMQKK